MFFENFQTRYTTIPIATSSRNYKSNFCKLDFRTFSHMHKEFEILLVLEGEAHLKIDSVTHIIKKGNIVALAPYTLHHYTIFNDRNFSQICFCFDLDILYDKQLKTELEKGTILIKNIIENNQFCSALIKDIFEANEAKPLGWEMSIIGNIHLLFGEFKQKGYIKHSINNPTRSIYCKIFEYISENYKEDITSSDVATFLKFNNSYFCRLFRKSFGDCFQNYLCMYRIEKSKVLLKNTDIAISEIASKVGFNSFSYYGKKFKEYTSLTPREYRDCKNE